MTDSTTSLELLLEAAVVTFATRLTNDHNVAFAGALTYAKNVLIWSLHDDGIDGAINAGLLDERIRKFVGSETTDELIDIVHKFSEGPAK